MKTIALFSLNAQYKIGGAETCINQIVSNLNDKYEITVVSGERKIYEKHNKYSYEKLSIIPLVNVRYLSYLDDFLNYFLIYDFFKKNKFDLVIGNCATSIAAINATVGHGGKAIYYVHDEFSLNKRPEYGETKTVKLKLFRLIRRVMDYPFFLFHCNKNSKSLIRSDIVLANSNYISDLLKKQESITPRVIYPFTQTEGKMQTDLCKAKYITMVGDSGVKGIDTFLKIANLMPREQFRVVGRNLQKKQQGNILFHPFFRDVADMYSTSKLLLVPSIWQEAFGKVSVEAASHGIPVIVSNRGGLPETVCSNELIVQDYLNPLSWQSRINKILKDNEAWGLKCFNHALKLDQKFDQERLLRAINDIVDK
ncbi:glycosyltransferase family 4 protein [Photobacterium sagamiensis]|uniref:glycosyltransferase family 4 protein n=1 Tax=Photobacterium sagamiensis TaxID=2910241 RepID=UPI003D1358C7